MFSLDSDRGDMPLSRHRFLLGGSTHLDAAFSAVVADAVDISIVVNPFIVDIVNARSVYAVFGTVIKEVSVVSTAAAVPLAIIAVTVVDPTVETNLRAPVSFVEAIAAISPAPIARRP
jgi:hypothetical protein